MIFQSEFPMLPQEATPGVDKVDKLSFLAGGSQKEKFYQKQYSPLYQLLKHNLKISAKNKKT